MRKIVLGLVVASLAGCTTPSANDPKALASHGVPPADYRVKVAAYIRQNFIDPYSIRDAAIAPPILVNGWLMTDLGQAWSVCVQANAKNRLGAYTGSRATIFRFKGDTIVGSSDEGGAAYYCEKQPYEPFPEIEAAPA